jgi:hypothetical protein
LKKALIPSQGQKGIVQLMQVAWELPCLLLLLVVTLGWALESRANSSDFVLSWILLKLPCWFKASAT